MKLRTKVNSTGQMMDSNAESVEKANKRQAWKPFLYLLTHVRLPWFWIALCIVISLFGSYLNLLFPQYTEQIFSMNFTLRLGITATVVIFLRAIETALLQFVSRYTSQRTNMCLQNFVWKKLSRLPMSYFQKNEPRELVSRTSEDLIVLGEFFSYGISSWISVPLEFIGSFILLFSYDWRMGVTQLIILPLSYVVGVIAGRYSFKMSNRAQSRTADLARYLSGILPNLQLMKLFGQEDREDRNGMAWIFNQYKTSIDNMFINSAISIANTVVDLIKDMTLVFMGVWLIRSGDIDIGIWMAFSQYAGLLYGNFGGIMRLWQGMKRNQGSAARLSEAVSAQPEANPGTKNAADAKGAIAFENVTFAYEDKNVLENVSFTAEAGQFTAIVGPSGAGKSTVLNLVERFYAPASGQVTLAGEKAEDYELKSWRRSMGLISQKTHLLSGTIRENIVYGLKSEVTQQQLEEAARDADILDFIKTLPEGFDTQVGEGGCKLSGGQRQRIAIARALVRKTNVLVLDEATANLDAEAEHNVNETLGKLAKDRTILMVAHHMDAVQNADKIVVLENGRVVGQGKHDQLMAGCELYRSMVELQSACAAV